MTLDGAKWHVSEIITKFGVQTREEAFEAWRAEQSLGQRFARAARALLAPILVHKVAAAGVAGALVLVAGGAIALTAYRSGGSSAGGGPVRDLPMSSTYGQVVDHPVFAVYQMIDSKIGWAQTTDAGIILTEDGGQTWRNASPALTGSATLLQASVAITDDNHASVAAAPPSAATNSDLQARVYWTADRGRTWHESDSVVALGYHPLVTFLDPQHGWIQTSTLTSPLVLYRTTDSGRTWQTVPVKVGTIDGDPPGSLPQECVTSPRLAFVSASRGFAYGRCSVAALPFIFRSDDGGATWQRVDLPGAGVGQYVPLLSFPTSNDGFIILFADRSTVSGVPSAAGSVYATHDGGLTWVLAGRIPGTSPGGTYNTLQFVDPLHGWVIGQPKSLRTVDGGQTWETLTPNPPMPSAEFVSPDEGFSWAAFPLYHTLDGGKTWQPVQP